MHKEWSTVNQNGISATNINLFSKINWEMGDVNMFHNSLYRIQKASSFSSFCWSIRICQVAKYLKIVFKCRKNKIKKNKEETNKSCIRHGVRFRVNCTSYIRILFWFIWHLAKGQIISEWIYNRVYFSFRKTNLWSHRFSQNMNKNYTGQKSWQFFVRILGETMTS